MGRRDDPRESGQRAVVTDKTFAAYMSEPGFQDALRASLSKHVDPERLQRLAITALLRTPKLQECSMLSLAQAVIDAGRIGLEVGISVLGHAYMVPFWNSDARIFEAQLMVSYKGKAELFRRSGLGARLEARVVRANDHFEVRGGSDPRIVHRYKLVDDRGPVIGYYAVAFFKDGGTQFETITRAEVEEIRRKFSKSPDSPAWRNHFDEMGKAKVCHRLEKMLPLSTEQVDAHDLDDEAREIVQAGRVEVVGDEAAPAPTAKPQGSRALARAQERGGLPIEIPQRERETVPVARGEGTPAAATTGGASSTPPVAPPAAPIPSAPVTPPEPQYEDPGPCGKRADCGLPDGHKGGCIPAGLDEEPAGVPPPAAPPPPPPPVQCSRDARCVLGDGHKEQFCSAKKRGERK